MIILLSHVFIACQWRPKMENGQSCKSASEFLFLATIDSRAGRVRGRRRVFISSKKKRSSTMEKAPGVFNIPPQALINQPRTYQVEVCGASGRKAARQNRRRTDVGTKPYARPTKRPNSLNHSQEHDFLSSYKNLTNSQLVGKFDKMNNTRIAALNSPAGKSEQKLTNSKKRRKPLLKRHYVACHNYDPQCPTSVNGFIGN